MVLYVNILYNFLQKTQVEYISEQYIFRNF